MATKAEIVQNLLDAYQITPEQAVILLSRDPVVWINHEPHPDEMPVWPWVFPNIDPLPPFYTSTSQAN